MKVSIRKFLEKDIDNKVRWINDERNNQFLHYEIPLEIEKTKQWFESIKNNSNRYDAVIEVDDVQVGLIGLLDIDRKNKKAEYYIVLGEQVYKGKGVAYKATKLILEYAFKELKLNRVYLSTEKDNVAAIRLYEKCGFTKEGLLKEHLYTKGRFVDCYLFGITCKEFLGIHPTPIQFVNAYETNSLYIKRDDLLPYSFGGNKARKAKLFFEEIDNGNFDSIVTYGTSSSNHCRVVANMAASRKMKCVIVSPEEVQEDTFNKKMMEVFGAEIVVCSVANVAQTIDEQIDKLREHGYNPYFIPGGGHGNIGTQAYVECYEEIRRFEKEKGIHFDYIFHASGTGTTQAGLVCGQLINRDNKKIVGISIARKNPRGRDVVLGSICEYLNEYKIRISIGEIEGATVFEDQYAGNGYGMSSKTIDEAIARILTNNGVPLDRTYTGKAFSGMLDYIETNKIENKNILFIHTGGTPLFFDYLKKEK